MKKESILKRLNTEVVKVFDKKNTTRMGGDYFCKTRRAWPCNPKVESLKLRLFFYFGINYLLIHSIFKININWNVEVKAPAAWEGKRLQKMKWGTNKMICNPLCGEPPASGERVCSMGAWGTKADANYVASVAKSPLHFPQMGKAERHATR